MSDCTNLTPGPHWALTILALEVYLPIIHQNKYMTTLVRYQWQHMPQFGLTQGVSNIEHSNWFSYIANISRRHHVSQIRQ